ncbi:MAG TPA: class I SAM-dependent methyltransferase [Nitrobacter sp.]|nr:class I SAM-dependent methyltransferase [Nitrobacter sp.]
MITDTLLGPIAAELGWVPAPRYLMRRARIQPLMRDIPAGRLLEIGPGAGAMLLENAERGFRCEALELSAEARELATAMLAYSTHAIPMHEEPAADWDRRFDVICAFEVLEHIEDDGAALAQWMSWLKPGGHLLLSVPAHMRLWNARDEWAGHVRRYERDPLIALFGQTGLQIEKFECYGFPLTNLSEWVSSPIFARNIRRDGENDYDSRKRNNDRSGIDRSPDMKLFPLLRSLPGKLALRAFFAIQTGFLGTDLGSGYLLRATKPQ